ncbi:MAG: YjbF family lipoprotein [Pseudotabrizicola sp.]|uniref:YjbF family lipoprotein n=1 Tax=Pseudotabrizicola sp. TaxID=2939647 RepID=UPI00271A7A9F|nr:YjbF family lipoprotein [Pseudotabrizicola sp.]MDO9639268.1 YjbF family lipoprotein [Pseudotabrizicola sp.]
MKRAVRPCLLAVLITASCGSDPSPTVGMARTALGSVLGTAKAPAPPRITQALLAQVVTPVMLVTIDNRKQQALIAEIQTNRDVATWSSVDDITLSFRNGVIVATRGFGADLMAADVPEVSPRSGGEAHSRVHTLLNGEDQAVQTRYACSFRNVGMEVIEIVKISYEATHIVESCAGGGMRFVNDFWFSGDQTLRKSRQWISPDVGYLTIEDVRW